MEIIEKTIDELIPYEHNPRKNDDAVEAVANSIREFGFKVPVVVDKDNVVVAGHTRIKAARELGIDQIPCIVADDLTDEQIKAYRLADNKVAELADWDFTLMDEQLAEITEIDMSQFGFDVDALDPEPEVEEVDVPEDVETRCKTGDLWALGEHRLICGDATDLECVDILMGGAEPDMVFTDPPYGMNLDTDYSGMVSRLDFATEKKAIGGKRYDQGMVDEFYPELVDAIFAINADEVFVWGADYFAELIPDRNEGSWIVWDKRANGNDDIEQDYSSDKMYGSCFELCWSKKKHKRDIARVKWAGVFGTEQEPDHKRVHPTQKPVCLSAWFIDRYTEDWDTVMDMFGGSGSTLLACEQMNRRCRMIEIDPKYCDVILKRWEDFTGRKAVRV